MTAAVSLAAAKARAGDPNGSPAVKAMVDDRTAPTAPLDDFIAAYADDDNWWWQLASGHHQNLFDAAIDRCDALVDALQAVLSLHRLAEDNDAGDDCCAQDGFGWPCATVRAITAAGVTE